MKYKRVLLKLSGEALAGEQKQGLNSEVLNELAVEIAHVRKSGVDVAIVVGGGNIHRGVAGVTKGMDRTTSDHMGMLATVINSLALQSFLEKHGIPTRVMSSIEMNAISEPYIRRRAIRHLEKGRVVIFAAGTGNPYFTTDTAAALKANEIDAPVILKATKVDGIYDRDPVIHKGAKKFEQLTHLEVLNKGLKVMDATAITLCMENSVDIVVFDLFKTGNIQKIISGEIIGTRVSSDVKVD